MTKAMQLVGTILWVALGLFATFGDANACSCAQTSIEKRFADSDYVFTAMIIGANLEDQFRTTIEEKEQGKIDLSGVGRIKIEFNPLRDYKGSSSELEFLYTPRSGMSCGFKVVVGSIETFFVQKGKLVGSCGGVLQNEDATEFYDYLTKEGLE